MKNPCAFAQWSKEVGMLEKAWEQNAMCSPFMIATKWGVSPDALPAIPVGAHGLVVIDCDRKPGAPDGVEAFRALCAAHSIDLSGAFIVDTPSGGQHYYFRTETPYSNSSGSLPAGTGGVTTKALI
jgi:hypothetical protein